MKIGRGTAPGKVILFGEHAVVYGRPALAVPVAEVCATVTVARAAAGAGVVIDAVDTGARLTLRTAAPGDPLAAAVRHALHHAGIADGNEPDWCLTIRSTIPIASGLGSGAAVSAAIVRAIAAAAGVAMDAGEVSAIVFEVERLHHGTPSGIDNTVIVHGRPVFFVRGRAPVPFEIARPFWLAIADSGIASPTRITVGDVRTAWQAEPARYEALFDRIGAVVEAARCAIAEGRPTALGPLMDENQALLAQAGVSCQTIDTLVRAAREAGAEGAKLSGGGRGGNMIALVTESTAESVAAALYRAGAVRVIITEVK